MKLQMPLLIKYKQTVLGLFCSVHSKLFVLSFTECAVGQFGVGCSQSCDCNGAPCDSVTGKCHCPAGQTGEHCEKGKHIK